MNNPKFPKLETERLILGQITIEDQKHIYSGLSNPEVIRYYGVNYSSFGDTEEQMNWYSNLEKSGSGIWWALRLKNTKEFCGAIGFNDYQKEHAKAEIGFWLLPEFWSKGFIQEAASRIIDYLFEELSLHRIEAFVEAENKNSAKALGKLGFKFEGRMIDCEVKDDHYIGSFSKVVFELKYYFDFCFLNRKHWTHI